MPCAVPFRAVVASAFVPEMPVHPSAASSRTSTEYLPPVLPRSAVLLELLLEERAIDLELATSVVALDPGLAFGVLQLANRDAATAGNPIWQLPLALVAAGREALRVLVKRAPRLDGSGCGGRKGRLQRLACDAVVRGCIAQMLARELGACNPKKSFLAGLLFELPKMAALMHAGHDFCRTKLSTLRESLPVVWKAATAVRDQTPPLHGPLVATTLIAQAILRDKAVADRVEFAAGAPWKCWPELSAEERRALLDRCCDLAQWAAANLYRLEPWDFLSRLKRPKPWESKWSLCAR